MIIFVYLQISVLTSIVVIYLGSEPNVSWLLAALIISVPGDPTGAETVPNADTYESVQLTCVWPPLGQ